MKELAGGRDEWQHPGDAPQRITWDAIRQYAPEVLLLCPCSASLERSLGEVCSLAAQPGWWALPAVRTGQVYILEHSLFSRPGPRYVLLCMPFHSCVSSCSSSRGLGLAAQSGWWALPAVRFGQVYTLGHNLLSRPGLSYVIMNWSLYAK